MDYLRDSKFHDETHKTIIEEMKEEIPCGIINEFIFVVFEVKCTLTLKTIKITKPLKG